MASYEIQQEIERIENTRDAFFVDVVVPMASTSFSMDNGPRLCFDYKGEEHTMLLEEHAFTQYCEFLGIPPRYAQALVKAGAEGLLNSNIMYWSLKQANERKMLRLCPSNEGSEPYAVRGIVSSRFLRLDNKNVLDELKKALENPSCSAFGTMEVHHSEISRDEMRLVLLQKKSQSQEDLGVEITMGIIVENNEIGMGAASVRPFFHFKTDQTSFEMPMPLTPYRRAHRGPEVFTGSDDAEVFQCDVPDHVRMDMAKSIDRMLNHSTFLTATTRMAKASETIISMDAVDHVFTKAGIKANEREMLERICGGVAFTNWDLVRQIATAASQITSKSRRENLENWAWTLLNSGVIKAPKKEQATDMGDLFDSPVEKIDAEETQPA
ncbi:hypothetical protein [Anaeromusa acidaminophila]|uniref:hypothetical protein n=1 Tax=Anaeromusa acidaminophila TaxID=81464 RepID=UPI00036455E2|nr:hypothetical protein [Anaeromusa acidaminophila]